MKYNDDGTIKEIKVKSFDTLPVGAEVDYDGETVPTGWTEVADPNTYGTEEVRIGTWFGKPLYRKVVVIDNLTFETLTDYAHGISNVDYIFFENVFGQGENYTRPLMMRVSGNQTITVSREYINYNVLNSYYINKIVAIVCYTKTTD